MASICSGCSGEAALAGGSTSTEVVVVDEVDEDEPRKGLFGREAGSLVSQEFGSSRNMNRNQQ